MKYHILFRTCEDVYSLNVTLRKIPDQRPFGLDKGGLIDVCFHSLLQSVEHAGIDCELWVVGDRLSRERIEFFRRYTDHVVVGDFGNDQSIRESYKIALAAPPGDWIYFCEDDYLHRKEAFSFIDDLLTNREKYLGQINRYDLFIHPTDYPDRYLQPDPMVGNISRNIIVHSRFCHWRQIPSTTFTFLCSSDSARRFEKELLFASQGANDHALTQHIYSKSFCASPIPALSTHMHRGAMSPVVDWNGVFEAVKAASLTDHPGRPLHDTVLHEEGALAANRESPALP